MRLHTLSAIVLALTACTGREKSTSKPLFELLDPARTGVTFANTITATDSHNIQTDVYIYNGAGVAVGDVDNDGLVDLFFSGNMVSSRLYRNRGDFRFEDVTARAGVGTTRWATGATMVDIDGNGWLDIYVSMSGPEWSKPEDRANLLYVNRGDGTFTEAAARWGIADTGFTIHAAFLDYDADGCLDVFLLNNSPRDFSRGEDVRYPNAEKGQTPGSHNQLYRNDCAAKPGEPGHFSNVSEKAGILRDAGYGLGVVVSDLNRDGRPDIYVSNDATPNDVIYVNAGDGTFTNRAARWLKHASQAGMGVDAADFNDDGWPDILQVDMLPSDPARRKRMSGFATYRQLLETRARGYRDDYSMNSLQLSNGVTPEGDVVFSDIARMAGVAATDWSWSALFADFDNDGLKDIFIGNGYPKAVNDLDYQTGMFRVRRGTAATTPAGLEILGKLQAYDLPNHIFRNRGDPSGAGQAPTFADETAAWGMERPSLSYGAATADLDNDGRLDLVVSNIDAPAFVYRNAAPRGEGANHWLQLRLRSETPNARGLGAKLALTAGGKTQYIDHTPYRGYMSTVDDRVHFGLGASTRIDSLVVHWPDGRRQVLAGLRADTLVTVRQTDATERRPHAPPPSPAGPFQRMDAARLPAFVQSQGALVDYSVQPQLPYMVSRQGPPLAVGDADGDGLDDVFVGGGAGAPGRLFLQSKTGGFAEAAGQPWTTEPGREDWGALFLDADGDGRLDLYVASGGYFAPSETPVLQDRLYRNLGGGRFARDSAALPVMLGSTAVVRAGDFTGDGRPDLFVGGRLTPRAWPMPARSYLLRNDPSPDGSGRARFTDVTATVAPELAQPHGMITDAQWVDVDGDRRLDLVTVGEWLPIELWKNDPSTDGSGPRLRDATASMKLPPTRGWWYSLAAGDFDGDGRTDLVAGNLGLNHSYTTSRASRFGVYAADFTGNRNTDVILTQEIGGTEHPWAGLATLGRDIYTVGLRFPTHAAFASATVAQVFGDAELAKARHYQADTFASVVLHNEGGGAFSMASLPSRAQIAPIRGIVVDDVDGDGALDLVVAGNLWEFEPNTPRADAGNGLWLKGDGAGRFTPVPPAASGFLAPKHVSGLALIGTPSGKAVLVANTGDTLSGYVVRKR